MRQFYIILLFLSPFVLNAQVKIDRTKAPKPAPAPKIQIADPATFTLPNGLKVFVVQNTKLPRVSATLTIDRQPLLEGDKSGLTSLAGTLLTRGTQSKSKAQLDEEIDFLGANLSGSSNYLSVSSLKKNFPKVMQIMADVAFKPALSGEELEKIRKQALTGLQAGKDDPGTISTNVVNRLVYGKEHPYGDIETENTLKNVTLADIKNYFGTYWKPNISYLVFVGDITPAEGKQLAEKYFSSWKRGNVPTKTYAMPRPPAKTFIAVVDRPASVQSLIKFVTPVDLKPGAPNAIPGSVMSNVLGGGSSGRLYSNLREKRGFTYGAYSSLSTDRMVGSFQANAQVRNEKTDSAIAEFISEFNRLRKEPIPADEVSRTKNSLSGSFARSLEQPATIANFALNIARYNLPKDYYRNYLTNLSAVTPSDVQRMANAYVLPQNMHIVIVGNAKAIAPGLEKYGEVKYFDIYGNEIAAPTEKKVDASVTVESIIEKAIEAMGGRKAIAEIKDISMDGSVDFMGNQLTVKQRMIVPSAYSFEVGMQGMVVQREVLNNGTYTRTAQGAPQPLDEKDKEEMNEKAAFFSELYMTKEKGYSFTLKGIEQVEGDDAYAVEVKTPAGRTFTNYYDVKNGRKVKQAALEQTPMGEKMVQTYFQKFEEWKDVKIPTKVVVDLGVMKQEVIFKDVKFNSGLKVEDFK